MVEMIDVGFKLLNEDSRARRGIFTTSHGSFQTPAFMPVGTQGTVKGVSPANLRELGAEIILTNTYHLHLRPGDELIKSLGGIHSFMGWQGPILSDSGGYQVFSLAKIRKFTDRGVTFQSHLDGKQIELTPQRAINIQENLGVDIMMVLDDCLKYPSTKSEAVSSLARTLTWAKESKEAKCRNDNFIFGIVQGGMFEDLRIEAAEGLKEIGFDGYAIGGLSVGEPSEELYRFAEISAGRLPREQVRYLMGVGTPTDIVNAVYVGVDLFDCVIPTRNARFGRVFTKAGFLNMRNTELRTDCEPIEPDCCCYSCRNFSRAYISHLIHAKEILGAQLATIHNLRFYQQLMTDIQMAIEQRRFESFRRDFLNLRREENVLHCENGDVYLQE